jgi:hypothetical protein
MIPLRREKVFGPGRAVPLDRNAKARIMALRHLGGVIEGRLLSNKGSGQVLAI